MSYKHIGAGLLLRLLGLDCQIQADGHEINAISLFQPPDLALVLSLPKGSGASG